MRSTRNSSPSPIRRSETDRYIPTENKKMSSLHGHFVWYELLTTDPKAAEPFYRGVLGWRARDSGLPDRSYSLLSVGASDMGGLMMLPPDACAAGAKPNWSGYVAGDGVEACAARSKKGGG